MTKIRTRLTRPMGFTLVELLAAMLIVLVLAATAVPQYMKVTEQGRVASAQVFFATLRRAQEGYKLRNGVYYFGSAAAAPFDIPVYLPHDYEANGDIRGNDDGWVFSLRRKPPCPAIYSAEGSCYTLGYVVLLGRTDPWGTGLNIWCSNQNCHYDLLVK